MTGAHIPVTPPNRSGSCRNRAPAQVLRRSARTSTARFGRLRWNFVDGGLGGAVGLGGVGGAAFGRDSAAWNAGVLFGPGASVRLVVRVLVTFHGSLLPSARSRDCPEENVGLSWGDRHQPLRERAAALTVRGPSPTIALPGGRTLRGALGGEGLTAHPRPVRAPVLPPPLQDRCGRPHTYLRLSVTGRCNLRCSYCMPRGDLAVAGRDESLTFPEMGRLARLFAGLGVTKVRLTGGEPLTRPGLPDLLAHLASVPGIETLALTTNGVLLRELAGPLKRAGLTRLNVSLDTLNPRRFEAITGSDGLALVLSGIEAALAEGFPLKLNTVVIEGVNDDELLSFVELARDLPLQVRFIELMPFGPHGPSVARGLPTAEVQRRIGEHHRLEPEPDPGKVGSAKTFHIAGFAGSVGFISPLTEPFCEGCGRLRITPDGKLKSCLFRAPSVDLLQGMRSGRSDAELVAQVRAALAEKAPSHQDLLPGTGAEHRRMHEIGG